jgi:ribonuclease VapC
MTVVLDASALLAVIRDEPGAEIVKSAMAGSLMSAVNASEALMRSTEKGFSSHLVRALMVSERIDVVTFDMDLALETAALREVTRGKGLSFADRACLATAIRRGATALTADRSWASLDLPCPIELIR